MATRSNALLSALANAVRLNPRLSAGWAFEFGVLVGAFIKEARGRKGLAGATAKLIDAVPLMSQAPARRAARTKAATRKRRTTKRAA
jgi:hypothetical protein